MPPQSSRGYKRACSEASQYQQHQVFFTKRAKHADWSIFSEPNIHEKSCNKFHLTHENSAIISVAFSASDCSITFYLVTHVSLRIVNKYFNTNRIHRNTCSWNSFSSTLESCSMMGPNMQFGSFAVEGNIPQNYEKCSKWF